LNGANITQDSARISIKREELAQYILWYLRSPPVQYRMSRAQKGVAVKGINIGDVRALQVALPPLEEQVEIVKRVELYLTLADQVLARLNSAQAEVDSLTQSTLAKVFRGDLTAEWREQNPDLITGENSAESLLARIQEQRASAVKPKRTRGRPAKKTKGAKPAMIVPILEALQKQGKPLDAQTLLAEAGYPKDASTEDVEQFMLDVRDMLDQGKIQRERVGDKDMFSLVG
jgi:type I restriction enzyme S subunit